MDYITNIFYLFGLNSNNKLGIKRGQRFIQINPPVVDKPYVLEFNGMLNGKMKFSILDNERDYRNIGGASLSEEQFESDIKNGYWKQL
jgi:hypothetical protein